MSEYEQIESFKKNGFVIIPDVMSREEVQDMRDVLRAITDQMPVNKRMLTIGDLFADKNLLGVVLKVQFDKKLVATLSKIIGGKVAYINTLVVQCNMFGLGSGGWHLDSGSEVSILTNRYLYEPNYTFGKVGFYLQDNTAEFGGGINVLPGSHKAFRFFRGKHVAQLGYRFVLNKTQRFMAMKFGKELLVPVKAGSAVYFDSRLFHRSTPPGTLNLDEADKNGTRRVKNDAIGKDQAKYVFYWDACSLHNANQFLEHSGKRAISEEVGTSRRTGLEAVYAEHLSYYYPDDYPKDYVHCVTQTGNVSIASVDKHNASLWKYVRDSFISSELA